MNRFQEVLWGGGVRAEPGRMWKHTASADTVRKCKPLESHVCPSFLSGIAKPRPAMRSHLGGHHTGRFSSRAFSAHTNSSPILRSGRGGQSKAEPRRGTHSFFIDCPSFLIGSEDRRPKPPLSRPTRKQLKMGPPIPCDGVGGGFAFGH